MIEEQNRLIEEEMSFEEVKIRSAQKVQEANQSS